MVKLSTYNENLIIWLLGQAFELVGYDNTLDWICTFRDSVSNSYEITLESIHLIWRNPFYDRGFRGRWISPPRDSMPRWQLAAVLFVFEDMPCRS